MPTTIAKELAEVQEIITLSKSKKETKAAEERLVAIEQKRMESTQSLTMQLEQMTGLESRVTILGHVQRGGVPSPADRLLASRLGTATAHLIQEGTFGVMVASQADQAVPVPLRDVVGRRKNVPVDHPWVLTARDLGASLGD